MTNIQSCLTKWSYFTYNNSTYKLNFDPPPTPYESSSGSVGNIEGIATSYNNLYSDVCYRVSERDNMCLVGNNAYIVAFNGDINSRRAAVFRIYNSQDTPGFYAFSDTTMDNCSRFVIYKLGITDKYIIKLKGSDYWPYGWTDTSTFGQFMEWKNSYTAPANDVTSPIENGIWPGSSNMCVAQDSDNDNYHHQLIPVSINGTTYFRIKNAQSDRYLYYNTDNTISFSKTSVDDTTDVRYLFDIVSNASTGESVYFTGDAFDPLNGGNFGAQYYCTADTGESDTADTTDRTSEETFQNKNNTIEHFAEFTVDNDVGSGRS